MGEPAASPGTPVRVALDVMGGSLPPAAAVEGALAARAADPGLEITLVGPAQPLHGALAAHGAAGALPVVPAEQWVGPGEDPRRAVRARRDASIRVAAGLLGGGAVQALVSVGPPGAVLAGARFTLGGLPGSTGAVLAAQRATPAGPVVLLDVSGDPAAGPDRLTQCALAGSALWNAAHGPGAPRTGLLEADPEQDGPAAAAAPGLAALAAAGLLPGFTGPVRGRDAATGGPADVLVTDGRTGNLLHSALSAVPASGPRPALAVLGVPAVVLAAAQPALSPDEIAGALRQAAALHRAALVNQVSTALAALVGRRREAAGLVGVAP